MLYFILFYLDSFSGSWWMSYLPLWLANSLVLLWCLMYILLLGDPRVPSRSREAVDFWRHRRQADFDLAKVFINFILFIFFFYLIN